MAVLGEAVEVVSTFVAVLKKWSVRVDYATGAKDALDLADGRARIDKGFHHRLDDGAVTRIGAQRDFVRVGDKLNVVRGVDVEGDDFDAWLRIEFLQSRTNGSAAHNENAWNRIQLASEFDESSDLFFGDMILTVYQTASPLRERTSFSTAYDAGTRTGQKLIAVENRAIKVNENGLSGKARER